MVLLLLKNLVVSILTGFLAVSSFFANSIITITGTQTEIATPYTEEIPEPSSQEEKEPEPLAELPSNYEYGGPIPNILIENAKYQQAAALGSNGTPILVNGTESTGGNTLNALVNIYCVYTTDSYKKTTAGTGFFIGDNGVILTNAHVAQFLLLEGATDKGTTECVVRGGNPARPLYEAELLYISPLWVNAHAAMISDENPRGTGERDYALLYVPRAVGGNDLPDVFPRIPFDASLLARSMQGKSVTAAGYPGGKLISEGGEAKLLPVIASTSVKTMYTFGSRYADIFSIGESTVGEHGASGGPVLNGDGDAIGLITTKGNLETEGAHSLRAITLSYIDRTIREETGYSLQQNITGDLPYRAKIFKDALIPILTSLLEQEL